MGERLRTIVLHEDRPRTLFLIAPVRNVTDEFLETVKKIVGRLEEDYSVYWPYRDTDQSASEVEICRRNRAAMEEAGVACIAWDGKSEGCLFDLGMAYAMGKPVFYYEKFLPHTETDKSFLHFIRDECWPLLW